MLIFETLELEFNWVFRFILRMKIVYENAKVCVLLLKEPPSWTIDSFQSCCGRVNENDVALCCWSFSAPPLPFLPLPPPLQSSRSLTWGGLVSFFFFCFQNLLSFTLSLINHPCQPPSGSRKHILENAWNLQGSLLVKTLANWAFTGV